MNWFLLLKILLTVESSIYSVALARGVKKAFSLAIMVFDYQLLALAMHLLSQMCTAEGRLSNQFFLSAFEELVVWEDTALYYIVRTEYY